MVVRTLRPSKWSQSNGAGEFGFGLGIPCDGGALFAVGAVAGREDMEGRGAAGGAYAFGNMETGDGDCCSLAMGGGGWGGVNPTKFSGARTGPRSAIKSSCEISGSGLWLMTVRASVSRACITHAVGTPRPGQILQYFVRTPAVSRASRR